MQYNVSHLLREPSGCLWELDVDEIGAAGPVNGERIQGQLRLTRIHLDSGQGVWAEARRWVQAIQVCDRRLRSFRQPVRADFTELYRTSEPGPGNLEYGEPFVDSGGVLDLGEVFRQRLILNLPTKLLCHPQCVGICPGCGAYGDKHDYDHNNRTQGHELPADSRWRELASLGSSRERGR